MDLRIPCLLCYWRACSCGREERAAGVVLRKAPRMPRERAVTLPVWMIVLGVANVAAVIGALVWVML